jgi:predicted nucleotidyltransferase
MMFEAVDKVKDISAPIVAHLSRRDEVVGILCFGSYALNTYDSNSDVDLFVLCDPDIIPEITRRAVLESIPQVAEIQLTCSTPGWENQWSPQSDKFKMDQITFDISYNTKDWISVVVDKVTGEGATSIPKFIFRPYTMLGLLARAIVLYDPQGFVEDLISKLYPYPPTLKDRLIQENLPILTDRLNELQDCAAREIGNTAFLFHLWQACDAFISILFALNETYDPATKRPEQEFKKLKMAPANLRERYEKLLEGPFDSIGRQRTVEEFKRLVEELGKSAG